MLTAGNERQNTEVVCACLIVDAAGRVCMVRESKPSALGRWSLPAGRAERGETLIEAAEREALEETGLVVTAGPLIGIYHSPSTLEGGSAVSFVFEAVATGGTLRVTAQHPEIRFFTQYEVDELAAVNMLRGSHVQLALAALDAGSSLPADTVVVVPPSSPPLSQP